MNTVIYCKTYPEMPFSKEEILRYAGCRAADAKTTELLNDCISEASGKLSYKVCYVKLSLAVTDDICEFGAFSIRSKSLSRNLANCESVILFGASVGIGIDRLIAKYGSLSPARSLMFQAIGAERIESLCDAFCADFQNSKPRFSPGYGDLPLEAQKDIFTVLACDKKIGLTLNNSMVMSPSKSVTAFLGLK